MSKTLVTLAFAAVPVLIVSACNGSGGGNSGIPSVGTNAPASQHGRVHPNDTSSADLHAGGADFPAVGYNLADQPVGTYKQVQATPGPGSILASAGTVHNVYYCLSSSGFGRKEFEQNNGAATLSCAALGQPAVGFGARKDPLDFAGTDVAMASTECCTAGSTYGTNRAATYGQPFELPTFGGPIVFGYNTSAFPALSGAQLQLSTWTYCAIVNGTISDWNDAAITKDNGGVSVTGGVSQTLNFYYRSDSSGTSFLFTNKLNDSTGGCNQTFRAPYNKAPYGSSGRSAAWPYGVNSQWPGPNSGRFHGESGNPGVLAAVQADPYGTGYVEGAFAQAASLGQAALQNGTLSGHANFVSPTNKTAVALSLNKVTAASIQDGMGSDGISLGSSTPWCQLYIPPSVFVNPPQKGYPIVGVSYWLFYGVNHGFHIADKKTLVRYISSSVSDAIIAPLEYSPLVSSIHTVVRTALNGAGSHTACLQ
jgi:ABC-type phosphate transport system substrate-binding protein